MMSQLQVPIQGITPSVGSVDSVGSLLRTYLDYDHDPRVYEFLEAWITGTYMYRKFPAYPQILMEQYIETGKSQTLSVSRLLSHLGQEAAYITGPALRDMANLGSSLFIDEFDKVDGLVKQIMKAGYKRGSVVHKMVPDGNGGWMDQEYQVYSPKMFATNESLDVKVKSRTIPLDTYPSVRPYIPPIDETDSIWENTRKELQSLVLAKEPDILNEFNGLTGKMGGVQFRHRERELWRPLVSIARSLSIPNVEQFAIDTVEKNRNESASQRPDYMLLKILEQTVTRPDFYRGTILADTVRKSLSSEELPFWEKTTVGKIMKNLFPSFKKNRDNQGVSYYITPDMVKDARMRRLA